MDEGKKRKEEVRESLMEIRVERETKGRDVEVKENLKPEEI